MKRVLFVDDEPGILDAIRASLRKRRNEWDMHFVSNAGDALAQLGRDSPVDVLVSDLRMAGGDGATLMEQVRARSPTTVRIMLSGYADERLALRTVSLAHRFLLKPCATSVLELTIDRCLVVQALIGSAAVRAKLGGLGALPSVPATFARLQSALADPAADAKTVARVIESDPAIVAKILQVVNSAFFRLPRRVERIEQAVSYLGLPAIMSLTLCAEIFSDANPLPKALDLGQLQAHAMAVARTARMLASGRLFSDEAFLAALLHDVGLLVMARVYCEPLQRVLSAAGTGPGLIAMEQELGIDHATAGGYLLGLWGCGYGVVDAVAHHHGRDDECHAELDMRGCVRLAEAAVGAVRPDLMPPYEMPDPLAGPELCRCVGSKESWDRVCARTGAGLAVGGAL